MNRNDEGAIHCLGNGELAVYEQGPNIIQVFGPPYSSPSFMKLMIDETEEIEVHSIREKGTAIWRHILLRHHQPIGEMVDSVDCVNPCLIRKITLSEPLKFKLVTESMIKVVNHSCRYSESAPTFALLAFAKAGSFIYGNYPTRHERVQQVVATGCLDHMDQRESEEGHVHELRFKPGESCIYIIGGPTYPECVMNTDKALKRDYAEMLSETREYWHNYGRQRIGLEGRFPENDPFYPLLMQTIDDYAILVKTQQGREGGILAGHNYHLGYIRDQYGAFRCLLKLGHDQEAKQVLEFYWNIWCRYGYLKNAQGIGQEGIFHVHENDDVEITAYLIIQSFDYLNSTGDAALLQEIFPMLEWAWHAQCRHLVRHMLPFNGDETYIACGVLPRNVIDDGSAEATMLFIQAGSMLLEWIAGHKLWENPKLAENKEILRLTRENYRSNFWKDGKLMTNNPDRKSGLELPGFRHGVCEGCTGFGWTQNNGKDRYVCPSCLASQPLERSADTIHYLQSVSLMHFYMNASIFSESELSAMLEEVVVQYKQDGKLPSKPDSTTTLGYDYGLFLYALTKMQHPLAREVFEKTLSILDPVGAWAEYYVNGQPQGTRYRPWEGGMNLEAAMAYMSGTRRNG
ncbi:hypothetical protein [Paenibacillus nasutitermitis]|nr:hypothetical protein [Paenibacillus nasutitermitis]